MRSKINVQKPMSIDVFYIIFIEVCMCYILQPSCLCLTAHLKVIYVHDLLKIVGNSVSNVQIGFISSDLLRSLLFGIACFDSLHFST